MSDPRDYFNLTISVPNGTVIRDDRHVFCVHGAPWRTALAIVVFFLVNYVAHAATVKANPGDGLLVTIFNIAWALLFPMSGLMRAINAIARYGGTGGSDLENACRAGALCMLVRLSGWIPAEGQGLDGFLTTETWSYNIRPGDETDLPLSGVGTPKPGDQLERRPLEARVKIYRPRYASEYSTAWAYFDTMGARSHVDLGITKIHGTFSLPQGYGFAVMPRDSYLHDIRARLVGPRGPADAIAQGSEMASSYSMAKALASLVQTIAAVTVLLLHRKDLIARWGYASFHLTILPYLVMTFFNFISNLCTADYSCLYMVESPVMDEARARDGLFTGCVAVTSAFDRPEEVSKSELSGWSGLQAEHVQRVAMLGSLLPRMLASIRRSARTNALTRSNETRSIHLEAVPSPSIESDRVSLTGEISPTQQSDRASDRTFHICTTRIASDQHRHGSHTPTTPQTNRPNDSHTCVNSDRGRLLDLLGLQTSELISVRLTTDNGDEFIAHTPRIPLGWWNSMLGNMASTAVHGVMSESHLLQSTIHGFIKNWRESLAHHKKLFPAFVSGVYLGLSAYAHLFVGIVWGFSTSCTACERESDVERKRYRYTLFFPACPRFMRTSDLPSKAVGLLAVLSASLLMPISYTNTILDKRRPIKYGILVEISFGLAVIGGILGIVALQSHAFDAGGNSLTQRVIMLLWTCEGAIGMILPLVTLKEIVLIFLVFPSYAILAQQPGVLTGMGTIFPFWQISGFVIMVSFVPLALFVAPVWGFVIVGKMLAEWGRCVTLY